MPKKILIPPYSKKLLDPPYPEHVTDELRERMRKGPVTLGRDELKRIIAMLEILSDRCGAAYHAVFALADYADISEDPAVVKAIELLAFPLRRGSFSPFNPKKIMETNRAESQRLQSGGKRPAVSGAVSRSASRPKKKT